MRTNNSKINKEERDILNSFEAGEWKKSKSSKGLILEAKNAAIEFMKKDARINIRISSADLDLIKQISVREGMPYQTLIGSVLHKFAQSY